MGSPRSSFPGSSPSDRRTGEFLWERETTYLADIDVDGHPRQALLTLGKRGILWALVYKHIDAATGQVALNESLIPSKLDETKFACPSDYGGKLWMATAYNPGSKTLFVPLNNLCMNWKIVAQEPLPGEDYGRGRMEFRHAPNNNGDIGRVDAINLDNKQTQWSQVRHPYWTSSLLATAGGVVWWTQVRKLPQSLPYRPACAVANGNPEPI